MNEREKRYVHTLEACVCHPKSVALALAASGDVGGLALSMDRLPAALAQLGLRARKQG
jgi:hypothetical protein